MTFTGRHRTAGAILAVSLAATAAAAAPAKIALPAGPLDASLFLLARQTGQQLLFAPEAAHGLQAPAVQGAYTAEQALERLLAGSGLQATRTGPRTLVIRPAAEAGAARPFGAEAAEPGAAPTPDVAAGVETLAEVLVTGSHIRGGRGPSPLLTLDRAALEASGHATVAGALNALPQVFGGSATEGTQATRADAGGSNTSFASSVNLRGLGPNATLVLINGRRVSGSGGKGEFVDVSTIPTVAVERVEVLLDGASAVYGADAVGGVVNIVLRKPYDGLELRLRGGAATAGEPREAQLGLAYGATWTGGGLFLAYEASRRTALNANDRAYTASADLRPFGGSDRRETFAYPGNILGTDPVTRATVPLYGIPTGQAGTALTPASFQAGTVNRQSAQQGSDILPDQLLQAGFLAIRQAATPWLELSADARYGYRKARALQLPPIATLTVGRTNPYYVSPTGAATQQIAYSFAGELPNPVSFRRVESLSATLAADLDLPADWKAAAYLGYSREEDTADVFGSVNSAILNEALGNVADRPETPYAAARDGYFNPYTGLAANRPAVLAAIASGFSSTRSVSRVTTANLQADGTLLRLPAGPAKLAVGGQVREERFGSFGATYASALTVTPVTPLAGRREVLAGFAELRAPLLADPQGTPTLELSLAARAERYSDFGHSVAPKAGLAWTPREGLRLRATYGESFRAPGLRDLRAAAFNSAINIPNGTGTALVMTRQGGNPDLRPETARSWTLGADLTPAPIPGLRFGATWFRTRFAERIDRPAAANLSVVLSDPRFAPFVQRLDPAGNVQDLATIRAILADPLTRATTFPAESFAGIVDLRFVNSGALEVEGLDLDASYVHALAGGDLRLSANATRLFDYRQQLTQTAPSFEFVGQVGRPARLRARLAADWRRDSLSAGLAANHTSGFRDSLGARVRAQTTYDLQAGWTAPAASPLGGLALRLTVRNLLDSAPPFYDNPFGYAYDPASGDPIGRFVALQLTRSW